MRDAALEESVRHANNEAEATSALSDALRPHLANLVMAWLPALGLTDSALGLERGTLGEETEVTSRIVEATLTAFTKHSLLTASQASRVGPNHGSFLLF